MALRTKENAELEERVDSMAEEKKELSEMVEEYRERERREEERVRMEEEERKREEIERQERLKEEEEQVPEATEENPSSVEEMPQTEPTNGTEEPAGKREEATIEKQEATSETEEPASEADESPARRNLLLSILGDTESYDILPLPHNQVQSLKNEVINLRARLTETEKWERRERVTNRSLNLLQIENDRKDQRIEEMEGDLKTMGSVQNQENMQYLRHTLVKFLCDSNSSEQQMILPAVSQLLNLRCGLGSVVTCSAEENERFMKKFGSRSRGWFS